MAIERWPEELPEPQLPGRGRRNLAYYQHRRQARGDAHRLRNALVLAAASLVPLAGIVALFAGIMIFRVVRYYDDTANRLVSPGAALAAVADYGGAQVYDRNGKLLYRFLDKDERVKIPVRLPDVSSFLIDATVSTEDATFWESNGVDLSGIGKAALDNYKQSGNPLNGRGGSSITQQLVKQTLIPADQRTSPSLERKAVEAIDAMEVSKQYSKQQILEWYLNVINYGGVYDGIESAAQGYFNIHARDLDLAQAAMLAGIPQSPARFSPYQDAASAKVRQAEVLDLMVRHRYITQAQADAAKREELQFQSADQSLPLRAPWFVEYVRQELIARVGQHCFETCGLTVRTTLDIDLEDQAQAMLQKNLKIYGDGVGVHNGALLSIDARTGEILVMVGSRDYNDGSPSIQGNNNFTTALLQPGSAFKPFVYMSLFDKRGYGPNSIIWDAPFQTADGYKCENPQAVGRMFGPIPVRLALASSLNCPANRAAAVAGVPNVIAAAQALGITTLGNPNQYGPAIATGGANISMLDMVFAYTTMARNGNMIGGTPPDNSSGLRALDPISLLEVKDATGQVLYTPERATKQVIDAAYPWMVTSIISDCSNRRLIWPCGFPLFDLSDKRPVASKTGTQQGGSTQDTLANWQFMYTPQLVTGGWVGNADRRTWTDRSGGANAVGYSVQQLEDLITRQYQIPIQPFVQPPNVISMPVHVPDASQNLLGGCGPIQPSLFAQGRAPDVNNRICVNGAIVVPPEQVGTGGLSAYAILPPTPTPTPGVPTPTPPPFILPSAPPQFIWPQGQQPTASPTPLPTQPGNPYPGTSSTPPPGIPTATPARTATPVGTATPKTGP